MTQYPCLVLNSVLVCEKLLFMSGLLIKAIECVEVVGPSSPSELAPSSCIVDQTLESTSLVLV
jgi:hypothetical protein